MALIGYGVVTVPAGGTPVNLADAIAPSRPVGQPLLVQSVRIQANPTNTGIVYIFGTMTNPVSDQRASGAGLLAKLPAPASATSGPFDAAEWRQQSAAASINLANIWIDVGVNGDDVIVSATIG